MCVDSCADHIVGCLGKGDECLDMVANSEDNIA